MTTARSKGAMSQSPFVTVQMCMNYEASRSPTGTRLSMNDQ